MIDPDSSFEANIEEATDEYIEDINAYAQDSQGYEEGDYSDIHENDDRIDQVDDGQLFTEERDQLYNYKRQVKMLEIRKQASSIQNIKEINANSSPVKVQKRRL